MLRKFKEMDELCQNGDVKHSDIWYKKNRGEHFEHKAETEE